MRPLTFVLAFVLYTSLSAAWPWPPTFQNINNALMKRQGGNNNNDPNNNGNNDGNNNGNNNGNNDQSSSAQPAAKTGESAAASTAAATTGAKETGGNSAAATSGASSSGKKGGASKTSQASKTTSISINPVDPAGGIQMLTPAATSTTYFKIGSEVTMVWNYTSLQVAPSAVDVIASNSQGAWTIATNMSVKETGSVVWNTSNVATPLPMESYTLVVFDPSAGGVTAVPQAGHLSPYQGYQFAMYIPKPSIPAADFVCVTCSGAVSSLERQSLQVIFGTALITVMSFSWFASGFLGLL